jgi:DNA-binding transcriptional ArsR family regulator
MRAENRYTRGMSESRSNVSDPKVLRALAHGVRNRILSELSAVGPMRAADLAAALDIPANQASFHLRTLAKYGLIVEAPEEARDGRDRVWKPALDRGVSISLKEIEAAPGGDAVSAFLRHDVGQRAHEAVDSATGTNREDDIHISISDIALRLTKDEAEQLALELTDLADQWRERTKGRGSDRRTYALLQILQPHPGVHPED